MRVVLTPLVGEVPCDAENLSIVGTFIRRFEEHTSVTLWPQSGLLQQPSFGCWEITPKANRYSYRRSNWCKSVFHMSRACDLSCDGSPQLTISNS
jgi:hypothetical protein